MRTEADQLLEDLDYIRSNVGTAGPGHPKVKKWIGEVRSCLKCEGNTKDLKKFDQLGIVRGGSEMWSDGTTSPSGLKKFKAELDEVEAILEKLGGRSESSGRSTADQKMRELFLTSEEEGAEVEAEEETQEATVEESKAEAPAESTDGTEREIKAETQTLESAMDQKIEPSFDAVTKQHLSASTREQAVDRLMDSLKVEMKSPEPNWNKIQGVMSEMMGLKKTGELLEKLNANLNTPGVQWEGVREVMAQLWSIRKEIIVDLLPTILET